MRILVYPHAMEVGGSQLNAVELAAAVQALGHEVAVIGEPGPLVEYVTGAGLEHLPLDPGRRRPSMTTVRMLRDLAVRRGLDVVHGYEWPPGVEAFYAGLRGPAAAVCTIMSMSVAPFLPASLPLVVGTREIQERAAPGRRHVHLIEPPVDVVANAPGHPVDEFRREFGLEPGPFDLVVVSRLVAELKLEGILTAIDVVGRLAAELDVRLVIVGDGPARAEVETRAAAANAAAGRRVVVVTGQLLDPRPAYAAATVCLAMGGSALRSLAFAKPLIVQGELGFFELLTPETEKIFLGQGWYGIGGGAEEGAPRLESMLRGLHASPALRERLGAYGRRLVVERFSLERAARVQLGIYEQAVSERPAAMDAVGTAAGVLGYKLRRKYERLRGTHARDDFNAVARSPK
ncbi:glycosyltransferase [Sphaerisporangium album]|uniref:Glycosyltransferase n=1 Tax=Sphaerisporangium album TaxID=509200 RepID=A0A367FMC1_9ACTN|nr:glycosyltransferase family 4 protein [Sphaerisporangium album]RCG31536.1 glycosyltransferase [Sphaerisporangium album]